MADRFLYNFHQLRLQVIYVRSILAQCQLRCERLLSGLSFIICIPSLALHLGNILKFKLLFSSFNIWKVTEVLYKHTRGIWRCPAISICFSCFKIPTDCSTLHTRPLGRSNIQGSFVASFLKQNRTIELTGGLRVSYLDQPILLRVF